MKGHGGSETLNAILMISVLVAAALIFLVIMLNDKPLMGEHTNTRWQNVANVTIIIFVIIMSSVFGISVLLPGLFGQG